MKDGRGEKIKAHYPISIDGQTYRVLRHSIDAENSLLTITTKVMGQRFPMGSEIPMTLTDGSTHTMTVSFRDGFRTGKVERMVYTVLSMKEESRDVP